MSVEFVKAAVYERYGVSLFVGVGIPIPVLDEDMIRYLAVRDEDIYTQIVDYGLSTRSKPVLANVNYKQLRSGTVELMGKQIPTAPLTSLKKSREIALHLKDLIAKGKFLLQQPVQQLPGQREFRPLREEEVKG